MEPKHKVAMPCSLTLSRPNLTLTLSKLVLKPLDMITKHYGGLYIFFNVYELPLDSRWANEGIINSPTTPKSHCSNGQEKYSSAGWTDILFRQVPLFSHIAVGPFLPKATFACVILMTLCLTLASSLCTNALSDASSNARQFIWRCNVLSPKSFITWHALWMIKIHLP